MRRFSLTPAPAFGLLLCLAASSCRKEEVPKPPRTKKTSEVVMDVFQQREAFNALAKVLRELAAAPPQDPTPALRATHLRTQLLTVPSKHLSPNLRAALDAMLAALLAVTASPGGALPPELQKQGADAAAALNQVLAAEGLTEFRF
jgi:hypothetical protein